MNKILQNLVKGTPVACVVMFGFWLLISVFLIEAIRDDFVDRYFEKQLRDLDEWIYNGSINEVKIENISLLNDEQGLVQSHTHLLSEGDYLRIMTFDLFYTNDETALVASNKNAFVSCVIYLQRGSKGNIDYGALVVKDRPSLKDIATTVGESRAGENISDVYRQTHGDGSYLYHVKFFDYKNSIPSMGNDIEPAISHILKSVVERIIHDNEGESSSSIALAERFSDVRDLRTYLALGLPDFLRGKVGHLTEYPKVSFDLYLARLISGPFQLVCFAGAFSALSVLLTQFVFIRLVNKEVVSSTLSVKERGENPSLQAKLALQQFDDLPIEIIQKIPTVGLIGTIYGVSQAVIMLSQMVSDDLGSQQVGTSFITTNLGIAFDTTLIASLVWIIGDLFRRVLERWNNIKIDNIYT